MKDQGTAPSNTAMPQAASTNANLALARECPFPPVMNLYTNFSGPLTALKSLKLCGATKSDWLYTVEMHYGYTTRGPLGFNRKGLYLRNGTNTGSAIIAAVGEESRQPLLFSTVSLKSAIMLPPLETNSDHSTGFVTEIMHPSSTSDTAHRAVSFRFSIEVGSAKVGWQREEFVWRKSTRAGDNGTDAAVPVPSSHSRSVLLRAPIHKVQRTFGFFVRERRSFRGVGRALDAHGSGYCAPNLLASLVWQDEQVGSGHRREGSA
ncbi:hypothetical protein QBC35DRAFT_505812 [Podospora australis]|uniref:Uncharacterized protein n=1 Tax=Podospora australis TaxID=1536484 RepID=A0AAN6WQD6_9PEZI|nr:hypothetical protein QBC35DRAFT_505812 [Podospora australis]